MTGTFTFAPGDTRPAPDFNIFFRNNAGYPFYSDAIWYLTQMRRWGQIPEAKADQWYFDTAKSVYRPDLTLVRPKHLWREERPRAGARPTPTGFRPERTALFVGEHHQGRKPTNN